MNVLLLGSGGREHALAWKLAQSPRLTKLWAAPGNPGIAQHAECVALDPGHLESVVAFAQDEKIGLVVVGPEQPLVDGLADMLRDNGILTFGPSAAAARLEGSKGFTKDLCARHAIPTARYRRFDDREAAREALEDFGLPVVIKADGLASGKGVVIAWTGPEAEDAVDHVFASFGSAGAEIVMEEFLEGEEASFFVLASGRDVVALASAQDHKRVGDGDVGPNTGGMGAYSPAAIFTPEIERRVVAEIIEPTLAAMAEEGSPYSGLLYAGLMLTAQGPKLIEYNCRFGDPETQALMPRIESDLLELLLATAEGRLAGVTPQLSPDTALTVVMAARGYPGTPALGGEIRGIAAAEQTGAVVFHAGTRLEGQRLVATGGRVLAVTARGDSVAAAQAAAYAAVDRIDFPTGFCRRDIGWRAVKQEGQQSA